jgi:uncharacterized protein GlcG (DUF336 family)
MQSGLQQGDPMKFLITLALLAIVTLSTAAEPGAASPPAAVAPPDELPLAVATQWAQAAIAACKANGYNVTATYMNANYDIKLVMRSDGARTGTVDIGRRKAYTVIKSGLSSGEFGAPYMPPPGAALPPPAPGKPMGMPPGQDADPNMIIFPGGLAVRAGGKLAGAISISGAPGGDKDVACANAGLAAIKDALK